MTNNKRFELVSSILMGAAGLMTAVDMIGETASAAKMLIVFFGGFGSGVTLMNALKHPQKDKGK